MLKLSYLRNLLTTVVASLSLLVCGSAIAGTVGGDLIKWHTVTVDFQGPSHNEMDNAPNPFVDYRLQVTFTGPSGVVYNVPGYFDGDGSGGATGQVWRVRFAPDEAGIWSYAASFRSGSQVAVSLSPTAGVPASFDGDSGSFSVAGLDPSADGFLRYGRLESIGEYYFKFRDGGFWIKGGTDSPENFLGFDGFDNTPFARHDYNTHAQDWTAQDPDWDSPYTAGTTQDGRPIIGVLNYLASQNINSIYFMPMDIGADGKDSWPYASETINRNGSPSNDNLHFDISKMQQWSTALDHAQRKEIFLHFVLSDRETATKNELDNATLGVERKLFYRELIARFGHFNALQWNISEEYNLTLPLSPDTIKEFAQYINDVDPYGHPVTVHNHGNTYINALGPFVGDTRFGVFSIQTWQRPDDISFAIEHFRDASANAGHIVPSAVDESIGIDQISAAEYRKRAMWDAFLSGGGHELFVRFQDSNLDNFRDFEQQYEYLWYARKFVQENLPFWEMETADDLVSGEDTVHGGAEVFTKPGEIYAIYLPSATPSGTLNIGTVTGTFQQRWYNPRTGQFQGPTDTYTASNSISIGAPPAEADEDWAVLITNLETTGNSIFQQSTAGQGLLSMEAESFSANTAQGSNTWELVTPGGQSGAAAMQALPNTGSLVNSGYTSSSPRLDYTADFTETGTHYVWLRGLGDTSGAGVNDSVHVGLDGQAVSTADRMTNFNAGYSWSSTTMDSGSRARIEITEPGVHTINVWMREDGLIVDKVVLTTDSGLDIPAQYGALGPVQSPQGLATLPTPVITPVSGTYTGSADVTITAEPGSTIYYTTNDTPPNTSSNLYGAPFTVTTDTTVRAFAVQTGWNDSAEASASYVISLDLQPPVISPPGGAYLDSVTVSMTAQSGTSIHYTTNDTPPTSSSPLYTGTFMLSSDATVRAITVQSGFNDSVEASESYTVTTGGGSGLFLQSTSGQGLLSMEAESYSANMAQGSNTWELVTPGGQSGAAAMQALPNTGSLINSGYTSSSPRLDYVVEFAETGTHYVWIRGLGDSDGASRNDSVHVGLDGQAVSTADRISSFNSGYSWSSTTLDSSSRARVVVDEPGLHTINVWMREDGLIVDKIVLTTDSGLDIPAQYGALGPAQSPQVPGSWPKPVLSPLGGTFNSSLTVSISSSSASTVHYTTDGSTPTLGSSVYQNPLLLSGDTQLNAIAVGAGLSNSQVAMGVYTQTACQNIRIMPVGDSITLGKDASSQPPIGFRVAYRRELFFDLVEAGYNVDFVGSIDQGESAVPVFDSDHEGHAGETDDFVAANIYQWLVNNPADYVLLHIGSNNTDNNAGDVAVILDEIDRYDTDIHVVVAQIINRQTFSSQVAAFNASLDTLVATRIGAGDKLSIVDMENAIVYPDDLADNLHPNEIGYSKMANAWFTDLNSRLPACVAP